MRDPDVPDGVVVAMWTYTVLRVLWWYGMAKCLKTGWGTRQQVEVSLEES